MPFGDIKNCLIFNSQDGDCSGGSVVILTEGMRVGIVNTSYQDGDIHFHILYVFVCGSFLF